LVPSDARFKTPLLPRHQTVEQRERDRMPYEVLAIGWLGMASLFGGASALVAARWGRDPFAWALLGAVLGPLGLFLLVAMHRDDLRRPVPYVVGRMTGPLRRTGDRVLLVVDGSPAGLCAAEYVIKRYGGTAGEVFLMGVLPLEQADGLESPEGSVRRSRLESEFEECVGPARDLLATAGLPVRAIMAFGEPCQQITRVAVDKGCDVILLGYRRGATRALLKGLLPRRIARAAKRPLVVVEGDRHGIVDP
jgi:nucleotide-binding universal stress UspA family protein